MSEWRQAPTDQTRVVVLYDDTTLYLAFTCLDARPELVRATQLTRDASPGVDDRVTVELDPRHAHRSVSRFTVTARGHAVGRDRRGTGRRLQGQVDTRRRSARRSAGRRNSPSRSRCSTSTPRPTPSAMNFSRYQNRTRELSYWADVTPQRLAEEAGHLTGLAPADDDVGRAAWRCAVPVEQPAPHAGSATPGESATGADVRYQWGRGLTSTLSARPDFSAVDADVAGAGFSYTEKFVADRRPFFQDGRAFFGDREIFHSGRIEDFDVGVKTFGRVDDYQVGVLATTDGRAAVAPTTSGRVAREVGPGVQHQRHRRRHQTRGPREQRRAGAGGRPRSDGTSRWTATSPSPHRRRPPGDGSRERAEIAYRRAQWYSGGWADNTDAGFFAADGFLPADCGRHDRPRRLQRLHPPVGPVVAAQHRRVGILPGARDPRPASASARRPASTSAPTPPPTSS